jgi:hypothetical protein
MQANRLGTVDVLGTMMARLVVLLVLAQIFMPAMTASSVAQPAPNRVATHTYQRGSMIVVSRGAVNRKNWVNRNSPVQSVISRSRQGCRWLYSGGPKSSVPPTC